MKTTAEVEALLERNTIAIHRATSLRARIGGGGVSLGDLGILLDAIREGGSLIREQSAKIARLEKWPRDCGLSWSGFKIEGDSKSIEAVKVAIHTAGNVPQYQQAFIEERTALQAKIARLTEVETALIELVALKDLKNKVAAAGDNATEGDHLWYEENQPKAWLAARAALAATKGE